MKLFSFELRSYLSHLPFDRPSGVRGAMTNVGQEPQ